MRKISLNWALSTVAILLVLATQIEAGQPSCCAPRTACQPVKAQPVNCCRTLLPYHVALKRAEDADVAEARIKELEAQIAAMQQQLEVATRERSAALDAASKSQSEAAAARDAAEKSQKLVAQARQQTQQSEDAANKARAAAEQASKEAAAKIAAAEQSAAEANKAKQQAISARDESEKARQVAEENAKKAEAARVVLEAELKKAKQDTPEKTSENEPQSAPEEDRFADRNKKPEVTDPEPTADGNDK